jgi:hypothetical protein
MFQSEGNSMSYHGVQAKGLGNHVLRFSPAGRNQGAATSSMISAFQAQKLNIPPTIDPLEGDFRSCGSTCQGKLEKMKRRTFSPCLVANPVDVWFT